MKITLKHTEDQLKNIQGSEHSITIRNDDLTLDEVLEFMVKPALISMGYHPDNVRERIFFDHVYSLSD